MTTKIIASTLPDRFAVILVDVEAAPPAENDAMFSDGAEEVEQGADHDEGVVCTPFRKP